MFNTKFQVILSKLASVLFVFWIYVLSPLMTISVIGGYGVKAADKVEICHKEGVNPWQWKEVTNSALRGHLDHGDFYYTNTDGGDEDSWCVSNVPNTPPTISTNSDITAHTTNSLGLVVTYSLPTGTDAEDGSLTPACTPISGSLFTPGNHTVTCTVTDSDGTSANSNFGVTIILDSLPNTPPEITDNLDINENTSDPTGLIVNFTAPTATDTEDGTAPVQCVPASGSEFEVGPTLVTCTATDSALATDVSTFTISVSYIPVVTPNNPPVLGAHTPVLVDSSVIPAVVTYALPEVSDPDSGDSAEVACVPASGTLFGEGITPVTCTATDTHGGTSEMSFNVVVTEVPPMDNTAPAISFTGFKDQDSNIYDSSKITKSCGSYNTSGFISWEWTLNNEETEPVLYTYTIISGPTAVGFSATTASTHFNGQIPMQGTYVVEVFGTDTYDNIGEAVQCSVTYDATAPDSPQNVHFDGPTLACGAITTNGYTTVDWNDVAGAVSYDYTVNYPLPGGGRADWSTTTTASQLYGSLNQGVHHVKVRSVDAAGNRSAWSALCDITYDSISPATPTGLHFDNTERTITYACGALLPRQPVTPDWDDITNDPTFSHFEYTSFWPDGHIGINEQRFDVSEFPNTWMPPTDGAYGYAVRSIDTAGNKSAWALSGKTLEGSCQVIYDSVGPVLALPANITEEAVTRLGNNVVFVASANDANSGSEVVTCTPESGSLFPIATTTVNCSATDDAGNTSTGSFTVTIRDTIAPNVLITSPTNSIVSGTVAIRGTVTDVNPHHYWLVIENAAGTQVAGPGVVNDITSFTDKFFFNWNTTLVPDGQYKVKLEARDAANNKDAGSVDWNIVTVDNTAPFLNLPSDITEEAESSLGNTIEFDATALDGVYGDLPVTCSPASGSLFAIGTVTVNCSAVDGQGNIGTGSFSVTVQDTTAPIVTPPANKVVEATGPSGAVVTYPNGNALDAIDGVRPVNCLPASGSSFVLGVTTVTCTASDTYGNTGTADFTITVRDTTKPVFPYLPTLWREATGPTGASVTFNITASDIVDGIIPASCTPASGSTFTLGRTTVNCVATDNAGNSKSKSFFIWVLDTTDPVFGPTPDITAEATGPTGARVPFTITATDLVDTNVHVTCLPSSNSLFHLGNNTVYCFAIDDSINIEYQSFKVIVVDTTAPVVEELDDQTLYVSNDEGTTATFSATATDIVDGVLGTTCVPASGSTFLLGTTEVTCSATDAHGNMGSSSFDITVIDNVAPTVDLVLPVASTEIKAVFSENMNEADAENPANYFLRNWPHNGGADGDLVGDATIVYESTTRTATITFTAPGWYVSPEQNWGVQNVHDVAGNMMAVTPYDEYSTPMLAPATTDDIDGIWHNSDVTVNLTCNDGTLLVDASGCYQTHFKIDDGAWQVGNSFVVSEEGIHTVSYYSEDNAGNLEVEKTAELTVKIDKTAPVLGVPVNQTFDETSVLGYNYSFVPTVDGAFEITCTSAPEGNDYPVGTTTVTCSATDQAGNTGSAAFTVTVNNLVPTAAILSRRNGNGTYRFEVSVLGGNSPYTYLWGGDCDGTADHTNTSNPPGTYDCSVLVTDADGDTDTELVTATIPRPAIRGPNQAAVLGENTVEEVTEETPILVDTEIPAVLGERTCTTQVNFTGYTYVDANKNGTYETGEKLLPGLTGKIAYTVDGVEYIARTFLSDQNGKFEVTICPGEYDITLNKTSLPTGVTDTAEVHKVSILGDSTTAIAYLALAAATGMQWSWWWLILVLIILGVMYYIYRRRKEQLEQE